MAKLSPPDILCRFRYVRKHAPIAVHEMKKLHSMLKTFVKHFAFLREAARLGAQ